MQHRVIYDLGSNNGDDIPYYLKKSELTVAVEANPILAKAIESRFQQEIDAGRLVVESKVLTPATELGEVPFYVHKTDDVQSQFPRPDDPSQFERIVLPACSVSDLIARYGPPHYVKIDIEHFDEAILRALFQAGIFPPFISSESHSIGIFAVLVAIGRYDSFKLVDGYSVAEVYADVPIEGEDGEERYSFPYHSAGPFGDDIRGPWLDAAAFFRVLAIERLGWKDIHATNLRRPRAGISTAQLGARLARKVARATTDDVKRRLHLG